MANFGSLLYNKAEENRPERLLRQQLRSMHQLPKMLYSSCWSETE